MDNHEQAKRLITALWGSIDFDNVKGSRVYGIWDEFIAKMRIGLNTKSTTSGLCNVFCRKFNVNLVKDEVFTDFLVLSKKEEKEFLNYLRENLNILIVEIRLEKEEVKVDKKNKEKIKNAEN